MTKLELIAKKYYSPLPYHNFQHALEVKSYAQKLIRRCQKYKVPVNQDIVIIAALFHDAGYDQVKNNKEAYSCQIAARALKKMKYSLSFIQEVKQTIMATKSGYPLRTTEQKILRAADLSGFMNSYPKFLQASRKIQQEYKVLYKNDDFPIKTWAKLVASYLKPNIKLTPEYAKDSWSHKARENIKRFLNSL